MVALIFSSIRCGSLEVPLSGPSQHPPVQRASVPSLALRILQKRKTHLPEKPSSITEKRFSASIESCQWKLFKPLGKHQLELFFIFLSLFVVFLESFVQSCSPLSQFVFALQTFISILGSCAYLLY